MSTIKLNGTTSGSSIIKAPDSGSTNQTFTLPASSGTLVTTTDAGVAGISSSADATAITISSAEKVGIGETSPTTHLLCLGEDSGSGDSGASSGISFRASNTENYISMSTVGGGNNGARGLVINRESSNELIKFCGDGRGLSQFTAKVWGILDGNTNNIKDSHNVSSITDHGAGDYTFNFTNNLASSTFCTTSSFSRTHWDNFVSIYGGHQTAGSVRVTHNRTSTSGGIDTDQLCIQVFGD